MRNGRTILVPFFTLLLLTIPLFAGCSLADNRGIGGDWNPEALASQFQEIAFIVKRGDYSDIYVSDADGSNRTRLTNDDTSKRGLAWSPDGTRVAYSSWNPHDGDTGIWVMDAHGSDQRRLTDQSQSSRSPTWSPDGSKIAYESGGEIWVMKSDGTYQTKLTDISTHTAGVIRISSSPVSYSWEEGGTSTYASDLVWSCDSSRIMFDKETWEIQPMYSSYRPEHPEVYEI
ncbi:MAG: PD40 domain-containing protein, partial [Anaerolineales bacterium]|nr:PD40 domain-containing protein [Anaerolineales bacterium]